MGGLHYWVERHHFRPVVDDLADPCHCAKCGYSDTHPIHEPGEEVTDEANPRDQVGVDPTRPTAAAGSAAGPPDSAFDLDWDDDGRTPPLLERVPWRIGVLDKDLIEDPDAIVEHASWIAGWYVHDCAELLGLVRELPPPVVAAGPPDLDHAIQAALPRAAKALLDTGVELRLSDAARAAHIVLQAAWPLLAEQLQATRDRLADLEVHAAELEQVLRDFPPLRGHFPVLEAWWNDDVLPVLTVDPPARGRAVLDEVQRLRAFVRGVDEGLKSGWDHDRIKAIWQARVALDGPAAQEDGDQACDACGELFTHDPQCGYLADSYRDGTEGRQ